MLSPTFVAGAIIGLGGLLLAGARLRSRRPLRTHEALPRCCIGDLEPGRFQIVGRIVPLDTSRSLIDGSECVYVERAEYSTVGTGFVPLLRETDHVARTHPFFLQDDTGKLLVDPGRALIDCARLSADGGLTVERRLRAGEEVTLEATFVRSEREAHEGEGPYRVAASSWKATGDASGPPRLSHITYDGWIQPSLDGLTGFVGGAGAIMMILGGILLFATTLVS